MFDSNRYQNAGLACGKLIERIRNSVIGEGRLFQTPFGLKPLVYADYTASGRSLNFIEDYITDNVLPFYANTHSEASATGRQTTAFREQARSLIKQSVNASDEDAVIFCGSGATSAIQKLVDILGIRIPAGLDDVHHFCEQIKQADRPVVFVGPYEHHSNELAWRESIADVIRIPLDSSGAIDQEILLDELNQYADRKVKIASFSAASNVTGLLSDVKAITKILHKSGALAFWDYAACGPYVSIDVTGSVDESGDTSIDGLYISPHKFIGGPSTPGVLVIKRKHMHNCVPSLPGGGTVSYVSPESHSYYSKAEVREEGGTPAIVESIRAGLVFQLKDAVGAKTIEAIEHDMVTRAIRRWSNNPNIQILGDLTSPRTSIISFLILWKGKPLHFGFVDRLINDLFGIQVRGGCSCAGPYGHELLGIGMEYSNAIAGAVDAGHSILKPGWVRLNFNYFIGEETFEYLLRAVELVAEYGWKMLAEYGYDDDTGLWSCCQGADVSSMNLCDINYSEDGFRAPVLKEYGKCAPLSSYLIEAEETLEKTGFNWQNSVSQNPVYELPEPFDALRWYGLPCDAEEVSG